MFENSTYSIQKLTFSFAKQQGQRWSTWTFFFFCPFHCFFFFYSSSASLSLSCAACFLPAILRLSSTPRWWSKRLGWTNHRAFMALAPSAPPLRSSASPPPRTAPSRRTPPSRGTRHSQQSCTSGPRRCTAAAVRSSWAPGG